MVNANRATHLLFTPCIREEEKQAHPVSLLPCSQTFLEKAFSVIDANRTVNLVIADFRGFGDWEYVWGIPPFSAESLPYTNMFHCSGMFKKALWAAAGGYPTSTLLGYEDWAFW